MDEPVQNGPRARRTPIASRSTAPALRTCAKEVISSAAAALNSMAKSRSRDGVQRILATAVEAERRAVCARSIGNVVPASAARPAAIRLRRARQSIKRRRIALSISNPGQQVMAEHDRLRGLQMREPGMMVSVCRCGESTRRRLQCASLRRCRRSPRADTGGCRSRPGRCASARCAVSCRLAHQPSSAFDIHVHIFTSTDHSKCPCSMSARTTEPAFDGVEFRLGDYADGQHARMRQRRFDVEMRETPVEFYGCGIAFDELRNRFFKAARPGHRRVFLSLRHVWRSHIISR